MARQLFYKTPPGAPHLRHPRWLAEIGLLVVLTYRVACRSCETALLAFGNESSLQHSPPSRLSGVGCCFFFFPSFFFFFLVSVQQLRGVCAEVWSHLMMALIRRIPFALEEENACIFYSFIALISSNLILITTRANTSASIRLLKTSKGRRCSQLKEIGPCYYLISVKFFGSLVGE